MSDSDDSYDGSERRGSVGGRASTPPPQGGASTPPPQASASENRKEKIRSALRASALGKSTVDTLYILDSNLGVKDAFDFEGGEAKASFSAKYRDHPLTAKICPAPKGVGSGLPWLELTWSDKLPDASEFESILTMPETFTDYWESLQELSNESAWDFSGMKLKD